MWIFYSNTLLMSALLTWTKVILTWISYLAVKAIYIDNVIRKGFIHHSNPFVRAHILFVKKKDGLLLLCVNYPIINRLSITNYYILPLLIHELLYCRKIRRVFFKINLYATYNLFCINPDDEFKFMF